MYAVDVIGVHLISYALVSVDNRGVVPSAEMKADGFEGVLSEQLAKIHGYLSCLNNFPFPGFGSNKVLCDVKILTNESLYRTATACTLTERRLLG